MRVTIKFDSATTRQVRDLSIALNRATGDNRMTVGVEGPECWGGETRPLSRTEFTSVAGHLARFLAADAIVAAGQS